jgi:hypothetical protein
MIPLLGCADRSSPAAPPTATVQNVSASKVSDRKLTDQPATDKAAAPVENPAAGKPAPSGLVRDISFDAIKFNIEKEKPFLRSMITPAIEKLADSKIRIRGYMLPSFEQSGLTQFVLVRDNMQCCFGPGAALFDCIVVQMDAGKTTDFTTQPVAVEGVFSIDVLKSPEDKCLAVYHMQADRVK